MTFLQQIQQWLDERDNMTTDPCPIETPVSEEDTVLGPLPPELRPLYQLQCDLSDQHSDACQAIKSWLREHDDFDPDELENADPELISQHQELDLKHDVIHCQWDTVRNLFWASVHEALPDAHHHRKVGLRSDWQVVAVVEEEKPRVRMHVMELSLG